MRRFLINVNGNSYQVEVEEVAAGIPTAPVAAPTPVAAAPTPVAAAPTPVAAAPAPAAVAPAAAPIPADGTKIESPMPGTILKLAVSQGAEVKKGDLVVILEAMKMENEIFSPVDGKVASLLVAQGSTVNAGDVIAVIA